MKFPTFLSLSLASVSLLPLKVCANIYGLGKSWRIGSAVSSTSSSAKNALAGIQRVVTTFNPGVPPSNQGGFLKLYPALSNGTGDLLLTSVESWGDQSWCGGTSGQWCVRTQVYSNQTPTYGSFAPLNANDSLTIVFERTPDQTAWTQTALLGSQVLSQLSSTSGPMTLFGLTAECGDDCALPISAQTYRDTVFTLSSPDSKWNATQVVGSGVYGSDVTGSGNTQVGKVQSPDGGWTWNVEEIIIPAMD